MVSFCGSGEAVAIGAAATAQATVSAAPASRASAPKTRPFDF
jgi:hypothetical protein